MQIKDKISFQSFGFYNLTGQIQENTILNRGLLDLGGHAIPQIIMSNNKDEKIERGTISSLYFIESFLAPFVLLPLFNRHFLKKNEIVKNFANNERRIIEVSKEYLAKDAGLMVKNIKKIGEKLGCAEDFENILEKFKGSEELLRQKLIKTHKNILMSDFLATSWMWCATPWIGMEVTKRRTNRSGYSATYAMANEEQTRKNAEKHEKDKKKKLLLSAVIATVPSILYPKFIAMGLDKDLKPLLDSSNLFKKIGGKMFNIVKKVPKCFDYTKGIFPSKTLFGAMWLLCDYPAAILSSRDKHESKDRAIRSGSAVFIFFGGDYILNNIFGRLSDEYLKTGIMDAPKINSKYKFLRNLSIMPRSFTEIDNLKITNEFTKEMLKKTKNVGAGLYWLTLIANMGLLGFAMPAFLNKILIKNVKKDLRNEETPNSVFKLTDERKHFHKFKLVK